MQWCTQIELLFSFLIVHLFKPFHRISPVNRWLNLPGLPSSSLAARRARKVAETEVAESSEPKIPPDENVFLTLCRGYQNGKLWPGGISRAVDGWSLG